MNVAKLSTLAIALAVAFAPAARAQSNAELLKELQALKERVADLEKKLSAKPAEKQGGMTPEQAEAFNRISVKTEALEDAVEAQGLKMLKISGFVDPTFIYNRGQNVAGFQLLNKDPYSYDSGYFGMALLDFQKEMDGGTKFRLTLAPERGVGATFNTGSIVHEATASIPLSDLQTRVTVGQIPDWSGYEYLPPTQTKLITHNLLFDFTLPTAYTGIASDITRGKWMYKVGLANVNAARRDPGHKAPAIIYRIDYSRGEFQGFGFAGVHGKLHNFASDDATVFPMDAGKNTRADLFEFDAYFIRGDLTWQGQLSWGQQKKAAIYHEDGVLRDAQWWGLSTLAAYKIIPRWEAVARFDYLRNSKNGGGLLGYTSDDGRNGIGRGFVDDGTGTWVPDPANPDRGANRYAVSLGLTYLFNLNTTIKAEYRWDRSNLAVFQYLSDGTYRKSNHLLGTSVVVSF
jgi:hypothetical protein